MATDKKSINFRLYADTEAKIEALATQYGYTKNEVASQILESYLDLWQAAEEAKRAVIASQLGKARAATPVTIARPKAS